MKLTLFLLLGYPGAGKTTFAKQLAEATGAVRINGDDIRRYMYADMEQVRNPANNPAVFGALGYVTKILLDNGASVILDAGHNKRSDRHGKRAMAEATGASIIVVWVQTPLVLAKQRDERRAAQNPTLAIPEQRYKELVDSLEEPGSEEKVIYINGTQDLSEQLAAFNKQLDAYEH